MIQEHVTVSSDKMNFKHLNKQEKLFNLFYLQNKLIMYKYSLLHTPVYRDKELYIKSCMI